VAGSARSPEIEQVAPEKSGATFFFLNKSLIKKK
jgi:hypothetical protein